MIAVRRGPAVAVGVIQQRAEVAVADEVNVATATTLSAIGAAHRDELLPTKRDDAGPTVARFHPHDDSIDEAHLPRTRCQSSRKVLCLPRASTSPSASTASSITRS